MKIRADLDKPFLIILMLTSSCFFYRDLPFLANSFWKLQLIEWLQLGLIFLLSSDRVPAPSLPLILGGYVISRFFLFHSSPLLEDDFYRYLWDGRLVAEGINPYLYPPNDSFWIHVASDWRQHINFPEIRTIYPPLAQYYFAVIYYLSGESLLGLRWGAVLLESSVAFLILKWIQKEKMNLKPLALFLFFPTLMKENINSVHFDLLATLFLFLFFINLHKLSSSLKANFYIWINLALAVLAKIFPLLFLPLAFYYSKRKFLGIFIFTVILVAAYGPFLDAGIRLFGGGAAFAKDWLFFESLPYYIQKAYEYVFNTSFFQNPDLLALKTSGRWTRVILAFLVFFISCLFSFSKKIKIENKFVILLLLLYSLSTVVNTWYWLWILPFLIIYAPRISWIFAVFTTFGYSWFVDQKIYVLLHQPVYGFGLVALIYYIVKTNYHGILRWQKKDHLEKANH